MRLIQDLLVDGLTFPIELLEFLGNARALRGVIAQEQAEPESGVGNPAGSIEPRCQRVSHLSGAHLDGIHSRGVHQRADAWPA